MSASLQRRADLEKASSSTFNERKQMSTKTSIKRLALVAVSALGFGLLSVVPAKAGDVQGTFAYGTLPTANLAAGGTFTVPVTWAANTTAAQSAGDKWIVKASVTGPTNATIATPTASADTNALDATKNTVAAAAGTGNTTTTGPSLTVTNVAGVNAAATVIGTFSFVAPVAGAYTMTLTATVLDSDPAGDDSPTVTVTDATLEVQASGASLVQAGSGLGTSTGTQVSERSAAAVYCVPAGSTAASRYTVTATNATITGANSGADQADAVNATSYTSTAGIVQNTPNSYATGFTYEGQRTTNVASLAAGVNDCFIVRFTSAVAGAATVTARSVDAVTGIATSIGSVTVTFGAIPTVSASLSRAYAGQGNAHPTVAETAALSLPSTASVTMTATATTGVTIAVDVVDTAGNALVAQAITATITGPGLLTLANDAAGNATGSTGTVRTASLTATAMAASSSAIIGVSADGTRGVGTITITAGGVTIATKTVSFYGAVASLTATQNYSIARAGRTVTSTVADYTLGSSTAGDAGTTVATSPAVTIVAKDADGNVVPGASVSAVIADSLVLSTANVTSCAGGAVDTICEDGAGYYVANVVSAIGGTSGASTTVTYRTPHPTVAGTFITSDPVTFTLGGSKTGGTVTMTLDKASYEPGERMILTIVAKDASGNPVYTGTATGTPSANKNVTGLTSSSFLTGTWILGDGATEFLYAPTVSGPFTITLSTGTATGATTTATATVGDDATTVAATAASDAALEAIDAANAATDAANLAAEAADAATAAVEALASEVATLMAALKAQITTLAKTVAKIAKKVKA